MLEKVVLDTDCIVRANLDHLFDPGVSLPAAVHAPVLGAFGVITSPDRTLRVMPFNSGMMVIAPNQTLFDHMRKRLIGHPALWSYDGGDQGWLASLYAERGIPWFELPRRYNLWMLAQEAELREALVWHEIQGALHYFKNHATCAGETTKNVESSLFVLTYHREAR